MFRVSPALSRTTMEAGAGEGSSMPETSWQCLQTVYKRFAKSLCLNRTGGHPKSWSLLVDSLQSPTHWRRRKLPSPWLEDHHDALQFVQDSSTQETAGIAWPYWPHNISQDLVGKKQSTFNSVLEELLRA